MFRFRLPHRRRRVVEFDRPWIVLYRPAPYKEPMQCFGLFADYPAAHHWAERRYGRPLPDDVWLFSVQQPPDVRDDDGIILLRPERD